MTTNTERLSAALADRYKILRLLGEGGMATVYLAEDIKHERQVALKLLRPELAAVLGADRFVQEIKTTANLQHPHILPLFDSGTAGGEGEDGVQPFLYYVMPFIDGETLRDKLDREKQLGVDEAVRITTEVADALDYAHRQGVIHRDIKPENILLHDGRPMVADFGIALALSAAAGGRMTETGLSLGTPHYMSPEQATAEKELTNRSDIYSLGTMLYEMLTGDPPHTASSAQAIIMKIVTEDAQPVTTLRKTVPQHISAAVAKSIEKLPADRFESAKAFAEALHNPAFSYGTSEMAVEGATRSGRRAGSLLHAAVTVAIALALAWVVLVPEPGIPVVSFHSSLSDTLLRLPQGLAISPDGDQVAITSMADGLVWLLLRAADDEEFRQVPGTAGAIDPKFSPDGQSVAFRRPVGGLGGGFSFVRIPIDGGVIQTLADSVDYADWGPDGTIIWTRAGGLYRMQRGGDPELMFQTDSLVIVSPNLLPDGSGVLFSEDVFGGGGLLLDFATGDVTEILPRAGNPRYVTSGHIVFHASPPNVSLMAVPFDLASHRITGEPVEVLPRVWRVGGKSYWDVSRSGTMVYVRAPQEAQGERLAWLDLAGSQSPLPIQLNDFENPRISPDGRRIAYFDFDRRAIMVSNISTGGTELIGNYLSFAWSGDGRSLFVSSLQGSRSAIIRVGVDGVGTPDTLLTDDGLVYAVSPDDSWLVIGRQSEERGNDIDIVRLDGETYELQPYLRATWNERQAALSPDGSWLAYVSDESGRNEIYVRTFPNPGAPVRISDGGGVGPAWAHDGSGIYYAGPESMSRVNVTTVQGRLQVRSRSVLFRHAGLEITQAAFLQALGYPRRYDVHPIDGRLIFVLSPEETFDLPVPVRVVSNWFEELRQLTGDGNR